MATGTIIKFIADRGFGFIMSDAGGEDIFFHITCCAEGFDEPCERQRVEFEERPSPRRDGQFEAFAVRLIDRRA